MPDISTTLTPSGGEWFVDGSDLALTSSIYQQILLAICGGNVESSTTGDEPPSGTKRTDFWGNSFLKNNPSAQFNSDYERTVTTVALSTSNLQKISDAARSDITFLEDLGVLVIVAVDTYLLGVDRVETSIEVREPTNLESQEYSFIWDATRGEIIVEGAPLVLIPDSNPVPDPPPPPEKSYKAILDGKGWFEFPKISLSAPTKWSITITTRADVKAAGILFGLLSGTPTNMIQLRESLSYVYFTNFFGGASIDLSGSFKELKVVFDVDAFAPLTLYLDGIELTNWSSSPTTGLDIDTLGWAGSNDTLRYTGQIKYFNIESEGVDLFNATFTSVGLRDSVSGVVILPSGTGTTFEEIE